MPKIQFAELHCLSNFSFLRAASHPEELITRACELGYKALAITDECSVAGVVRAWRSIQEQELNIRLIIGSEFAVEGHCIVLLAKNQTGYQQLCRLITRAPASQREGQLQ